MRSRYSAYVSGHIDYLLATHHPKSPDPPSRQSIESWSKEASWQGLEIVADQEGGPSDERGVVEFIARYESHGHAVAHHERAEFRKVGPDWYYHDGVMVKPKPVVREARKIGRNEPCPCGSGKKYKKCCGGAATASGV